MIFTPEPLAPVALNNDSKTYFRYYDLELHSNAVRDTILFKVK